MKNKSLAKNSIVLAIKFLTASPLATQTGTPVEGEGDKRWAECGTTCSFNFNSYLCELKLTGNN